MRCARRSAPPPTSSCTGVCEGQRVAFLPRHGRGHRILPHELNFRANIYALKSLGVDAHPLRLRGRLAQGGDTRRCHVVVPDQFVDRTRRRERTFFGERPRRPRRVRATRLRRSWQRCWRPRPARRRRHGARAAAPTSASRARSSRRAPSRELYRSWGIDIIGMTNLPEAKLAREARDLLRDARPRHRLRLLASRPRRRHRRRR